MAICVMVLCVAWLIFDESNLSFDIVLKSIDFIFFLNSVSMYVNEQGRYIGNCKENRTLTIDVFNRVYGMAAVAVYFFLY